MNKEAAGKCLNSFNEFYFTEFSKMVRDARNKNCKNLMVIYRKVVLSIQKYPFPILSPAQASLLEGVGETICKTFENLIKTYRSIIEKDNINFIEKAYELNMDNKFKDKKGQRRKGNADEDSKFKSGIKSRKMLVNVDLYSSVWTTVISAYILYLQLGITCLEIDDIQAMARTISEELGANGVIQIKPSEGMKDFQQMKILNVIDSIDSREKKIKINDSLIKLAQIELRKSGIVVENDGSGGMNFSVTNPVETKLSNGNPLNSSFASSQGGKSSKQSINNQTLDSFITSSKINNDDKVPLLLQTTIISKNKSDKDILVLSSSLLNDENGNGKRFIQFRSKTKNNDNVILLVDNRERGSNSENFREEILSRLPFGIKVQERNLAVGDFMWVYEDSISHSEYVLDIIIERKTLPDLASSIIDGRYNEQKYRLKNTHFTNVQYIFEGTNYANSANLSKQSLCTAIYNTLNIHDIHIIRTLSTIDSVNYLIKTDANIKKCLKFLTDENGNKITFTQFTQNNAKTKNSSVESIFLRQLRSFNDCGTKSVDMIRRVFKCPKVLYSILKKCQQEIPMHNLINLLAVAGFLIENNIDHSQENLIYYLREENYSKIKKQIKSVKKIRKTANESIIKFYSPGHEIENQTEEVEEVKEEMNASSNSE